MEMRIAAALEACPLFAALGSSERARLAGDATPLCLDPGEVLYRANQSADRLFLVIEGTVALRDVDRAGYGIGPFRMGDVVGTEALVAGGRYAQTAVALEPALAWPIASEPLLDLLEERFGLTLAMMASVAAALRHRVKTISDFKLQSTCKRLAGYLVQLAPAAIGSASVRLPCEKRVLAEYLGMDPATLSRAFARLRPLGVARHASDRVAIADLDRLRAFTDVAPALCRPLCFNSRPRCGRAAPEHSPSQAGMLARRIADMPMFAGLPPATLQRLLADAIPRSYSSGHLLFSAGEPADCFFIVLSGQVKLFALMPDGRESIIEVVRPVASFAEAAVLAGSSFPLSAEVIADSVLVRVGSGAFLSTLHADHAVAYRILASLCARQQRLTGEAGTLRRHPAWLRVAEYLLTLTPACSGEAILHLPFTREVLASRMGIRRESLSRVLARLQGLGVKSHGATVRIGDVAALRAAISQSAHEARPEIGSLVQRQSAPRIKAPL